MVRLQKLWGLIQKNRLCSSEIIELTRDIEASTQLFIWAIKEAKPPPPPPVSRESGSMARDMRSTSRIGVRLSGVTAPLMFLPNEAEDVQVASTSVEKSVAKLMDGGTDNAARRAPGRELAVRARAAVGRASPSRSCTSPSRPRACRSPAPTWRWRGQAEWMAAQTMQLGGHTLDSSL
uniref:Uncharacterized protein n=1 Tax=Oryza glaberrima TaxID=4538 RepID=I1PJA6_ORYGL